MMRSVLQCIEIRLKAYEPVSCIRREDCTRIRRFEVFRPERGAGGAAALAALTAGISSPPADASLSASEDSLKQKTAGASSPPADTSLPAETLLCPGPAGGAASRTAETLLCLNQEDGGYAPSRLQEDTLYYMEETLLRALPEEALPCNMICCGADPEICPGGHNLIRLAQPAAPEDLAGIIRLTLEQIAQYEAMMPELLQIMDKEGCAQEMVDCYSRRMRLCTAVRDTSLKSISFTSESAYPVTLQEPFRRIVHEDFLSEESMELMEEYNRLKNISGDVPYTIIDYRSLPETLPIPEEAVSGLDFTIRSGNDSIALLTAMSFERMLDGMDADITLDFVRLLSLVLVRDGLVHRQPYGAFGSILHDVITETITDEDLIRDRLSALKWPAAEDLYLAVLTGDQAGNEQDPARLRDLRHDLAEIVPGSITDVYQGRAYFLIGRPAGGAALPVNHRRLQLFLKTHRAVLGISAVFHEVATLNIHYLQALSAANVGRRVDPGQQEYFFWDYSVELSVASLMRSPQAELRSFCHPVVLALYESSRPGDHDLLDTLERYLLSLQDVNQTCAALHIHRSTLYYRLNKLKELLGEDALHDGRCVQRLMYSFTVLQFLDAARSVGK